MARPEGEPSQSEDRPGRLGQARHMIVHTLQYVAIALPLYLGANYVLDRTGVFENEEETQSPTASAQPVLTQTPQETPIVHEPPYTSIPQVPPKDRGSLESIMEYWKAKRLEGNKLKLVVNEFYELDVIGLALPGDVVAGPGSTTVYAKGGSVEANFGIRRQACADILDAGGPNAAGIIVHFDIIVPNAGQDPFSEIGFTEGQKEEFLTPTACEAVL